MKPFRNFIFLSIIFLAISFLIVTPTQAGTFTATLGEDGIVHLDADFTEDFNCIPGGTIPKTTIAEIYGCYSVMTPGWTASGQRKFLVREKRPGV